MWNCLKSNLNVEKSEKKLCMLKKIKGGPCQTVPCVCTCCLDKTIGTLKNRQKWN